MAMPAWVSELGVVGTLVVAVAAIWGERIRAMLLKPDLRLELASSVGEFTTQVLEHDGKIVGESHARYYHLRVVNRRVFPAAHDVQIFMTKIEIPGPDGLPQTIYSTPLPLIWQFPMLYPQARTIGHTTVAVADMFFVRPDFLRLTPMITPPNNLKNTFQPEAHFWISAVARGIDGESSVLRLKVDWDGGWERGDTEMGRHLTVSPA